MDNFIPLFKSVLPRPNNAKCRIYIFKHIKPRRLGLKLCNSQVWLSGMLKMNFQQQYIARMFLWNGVPQTYLEESRKPRRRIRQISNRIYLIHWTRFKIFWSSLSRVGNVKFESCKRVKLYSWMFHYYNVDFLIEKRESRQIARSVMVCFLV